MVLLMVKPDPAKKLPVLGEEGHRTGKFALLTQDSVVYNSDSLAGSIRVVEFFFTTCKGICPKMNGNMKKLYLQFRSAPQVKFVSFTVDPLHDTPSVLKKYALQQGADGYQWIFLTGQKDSLYRIAREQYLLSAAPADDVVNTEEFIHTQYFALVDAQNQIRGFYDGTSEKEMIRLMADIKILLA
ncbi:protein SCO1/2 [Sediminibacterium goheungense]|uniref:Protein SCO1/2 n=2 Tax=Sediminibacterium goheungense TaxID=1086393 RepID=A0A4R6IVZ2_9BACT|nr:protein SCO1/2 [Sediminibacterium goheungense]